jgi:aspartate/methionine/tyrosine aminotransferase
VSSRYPLAVIREKLFARRGDVADFAFGGRKVSLPDELADWIDRNASLALRAASPTEKESFDEAAKALLANQYQVDPDSVSIVAMSGGRNAMSAYAAAVLEAGDKVIVTEPGYPAFARLAAQRGADVHSVRLDPAREFAPDFGSLDESVIHDLRTIFLNYPNNPTGAVLTDSIRNQVFDVAKRSSTDSVIFNDAVYGPLSYDGAAHSLLRDGLTGLSGVEVLELHSLTKLFPLGPLSMSFLAGSRRLVGEIAEFNEYAAAPASALQVQATTRCLCDTDGCAETREFFIDQVRSLRKTLIEVGFEPFPTPSGIYVLCRAPSEIAGQVVASAEEAAMRLLDDFDLAVVPWDVGSDRYLRFTALYRPEDLEQLAALSGRLVLHQA